MSLCKYYAANGSESKLFDDLYKTANSNFGFEGNQETIALTAFLNMHSENYKRNAGDWTAPDYSGVTYPDTKEPKLERRQLNEVIWQAYQSISSATGTGKSAPVINDPSATMKALLKNLKARFNIPFVIDDTLTHPTYENGVVRINPNNYYHEMAFHEYAHPLVALIRTQSPAAYNRLYLEAVEVPGLVNEIKTKYPEYTETELKDEVITTVLGRFAAEANALKSRKGLVAAFKEFMKVMTDFINKFLGFNNKISVNSIEQGMSLRELGFYMGATDVKFDVGSVQDEFVRLMNHAESVEGNTAKIKLNHSRMQFLDNAFGKENVRVLREPSDDDPYYLVNVTNPLGTRIPMALKQNAKVEKPKPEPIKLTGTKIVDNMIKDMTERMNFLKLQRKGAKTKIQLNKIDREIKATTNKIADIYRTNTANVIITYSKDYLNQFQRQLRLPLNLTEIQSRLKLLRSFTKIGDYIKTDDDPDMVQAADSIITKANRLFGEYTMKELDTFKQELQVRGVKQEWIAAVDKPTVNIGAIDLYLFGSSSTGDKLEISMDYLIRKSQDETIKMDMEFNADLQKHDKAINGNWASFVKDGKLITKYDGKKAEELIALRDKTIETSKKLRDLQKKMDDLISERQRAERTSDTAAGEADIIRIANEMRNVRYQIEALRASSSWKAFYQTMGKYFTFELTEEGRQEWQEFKEVLKEDFYRSNAEGKEWFDEKAYSNTLEYYQPDNFKDMIDGGPTEMSGGGRFFAINIRPEKEAELYSSEYKALTGAHKNAFQFMHDKFIESHSYMYNYAFDKEFDVDVVLQDLMNSSPEVKNKLIDFSPLKEFIQDIYSVKPSEEKDTGVRGVYSNKDRRTPRSKHMAAFIDPKKPLEKQNISKIFAKYYKAGITYKHKARVEEVLDTGKELSYMLPMVEVDSEGNTKPVGGRSNVSKRIEHLVDLYLYDDYKDKVAGFGKTGEGRMGSLEQIGDSLNDLTRFRQMGLNPLSAVSNLFIGTASNWFHAGEGQFFNEKELRQAYALLRGPVMKAATLNKVDNPLARKISLLMVRFNLMGQLQEKDYESNFSKVMFGMQQGGEYLNQGAAMVASLLHKKVADKTGKMRPMFEALEEKDGRLIINKDFDANNTELSEDRIFDIGVAIRQNIKRIHGDYDPNNLMFLKKSVLGRMAATFRTWMPQAFSVRFGKERVDEYMSLFENKEVLVKGRFRSLASVLFNDKEGFAAGLKKNGLQVLTNYAVGFIPFTGKQVMDYGEMSETDKRNLAVALRELRFYTLISLLLLVLGKMKDDDDDLKKKSWFAFANNMAARFENELSFFFSIQSMNQTFLKDIVPLSDTVDQMRKVIGAGFTAITDPKADVYKQGFRKGSSKFWKEFETLIPGLKQHQNMWSFFSQIYK